jgi:hypothetical protein
MPDGWWVGAGGIMVRVVVVVADDSTAALAAGNQSVRAVRSLQAAPVGRQVHADLPGWPVPAARAGRGSDAQKTRGCQEWAARPGPCSTSAAQLLNIAH